MVSCSLPYFSVEAGMIMLSSEKIVDACISYREAPVLEDIRHINRMTYRGDRTGANHRHLMHSSFPV